MTTHAASIRVCSRSVLLAKVNAVAMANPADKFVASAGQVSCGHDNFCCDGAYPQVLQSCLSVSLLLAGGAVSEIQR